MKTEDGQLVVSPSLTDAKQLAQKQSGAAAVSLGRHTFNRNDVRAELIQLAREYADAIGVTCTLPGNPDVLYITGHQPEFVHPGILTKNIAAAALAGKTGGALNLTVDTSPLNLDFIYPSVESGIAVIKKASVNNCYHDVSLKRFVYSNAEFRECVFKTVNDIIAATPYGSQKLSQPRSSSLRDQMVIWRREMESQAGIFINDIPLTVLCRSASFAQYITSVLDEPARFAEIYNTALYNFRTRHRIRNHAHPASDLVSEDRIELPFWVIDEQSQKQKLFVKQNKHNHKLYVEDQLVFSGTADEFLEYYSSALLLITPRAFTLTLYLRAVPADLFIHGTGGGLYDEVTDEIAHTYYNVSLPQFMIASSSLYLQRRDDKIFSPHGLQQEIRRADQHPEYFLGDSEEERELLKRHDKLIQEMKNSYNKKQIHIELADIKNSIKNKIISQISGFISNYNNIDNKFINNDTFRERAFPWLFYTVDQLTELHNQLLSGFPEKAV